MHNTEVAYTLQYSLRISGRIYALSQIMKETYREHTYLLYLQLKAGTHLFPEKIRSKPVVISFRVLQLLPLSMK